MSKCKHENAEIHIKYSIAAVYYFANKEFKTKEVSRPYRNDEMLVYCSTCGFARAYFIYGKLPKWVQALWNQTESSTDED